MLLDESGVLKYSFIGRASEREKGFDMSMSGFTTEYNYESLSLSLYLMLFDGEFVFAWEYIMYYSYSAK